MTDTATVADPASDRAVAIWSAHRDRAFRIAYRLLGSVTDADDVLQEAYLRLRSTDLDALREPAAWLTTVVTRLCLNHLDAARVRREAYVGPWLPEPVDTSADPHDDAVLAESISAAFLVVLESLSPAERVAFVLHDVFGHPYDEVAAVLERSEEACRQLATRARKAVDARRPRFTADAAQRHTASERFIQACAGHDLDALLTILAPDVSLSSDGGGKARAARNVVHGADRAGRFLVGVLTRRGGIVSRVPSIHGAPGVAWHDQDGTLIGVMSTTVDERGLVSTINLVVNPDKLRHLGP